MPSSPCQSRRVGAGGTSTVVRADGDDLLVTDGPYAEGKEFVGGFDLIEAPDLDGALHWAGRLARITGLPIEVRPVVQGF